MLFYNNSHKQFYYYCLQQCHNHDSYHKSLFYTLSMDKDIREHFKEVYSFKEDCIKIDGLNKAWHTSGSYKTTLLGFNLWNGYKDNEICPDQIFNCEYAKYYLESIKLRFPIYFRERHHSLMK